MRLGRQLWVCKVHRRNENSQCWSCWAALDFNTLREYCACGAPAVGYVTEGRDVAVKFYCEDHWGAAPKPPVPVERGEREEEI
jgi:hypothetical protein